MEEKYKWYKLDNAAKVFPDTTNRGRSNMFRVAVYLHELVQPETLQQAVEDLKPRFPTYYVKLKSGLFWYYTEYNEHMPKVEPESPYVCLAPNFKSKDGYLFHVYYYQNRIAVEMFHAVTDGNGLVEFVKSIVFRYLQLRGEDVKSEGLVLTADGQPHELETEDSFLKHYTSAQKGRDAKIRAYKLKGTSFASREGGGIINGKFPAEQLVRLAKQSDCTVTCYIAGLVTWCVYQIQRKNGISERPIRMFMPVNMRKFYDSQTLRNFVLYLYTNVAAAEEDWTLEGMLALIKQQMADGLKPENMQKVLNANVAIEKNFALKFVPLFIKQFAIKIGFNMLGNKLMTCALSNLGDIRLPESMQRHVKYMDWAVGVARESTHDISVLSNNGVMSVNFMRSIYETELEKLFFRELSARGVDVTVDSNLWEEKV